MKSPLPINTRFSGFRFSLSPPRLSVSPLSPRSPKLANTAEQSLSICHSSGKTSPTARGSPSPHGHEKDSASLAVTVVDGEGANCGLATPNALPFPACSPITPWHATFHRNAASTDQETAYLRRTSYLRYARLALAILLLSTGATVTALEGDILRRYRETNLPASFYLSLWPTDLNLTPTILMLSTGAATTFLALITIIIAAIPSPNPRTKLNNSLFTLLCGLVAPLVIACVVIAGVVSPDAIFGSFISKTLTSLVSTTGPSNTVGLTPNGAGSNPKRETIQSFTCAISNTAKAFNGDAVSLLLPSLDDVNQLIPSGFAKICTENRASLAIVITVLILAVIGSVVAGMSWVVEKRIEGLRGEREVLASRDGQNVPESLVGIPYEKSNVGS